MLTEFLCMKGNSASFWGQRMRWKTQGLLSKNLRDVPPQRVLRMLIQSSLLQSSDLAYLGTNSPIRTASIFSPARELHWRRSGGGGIICQASHLDFIQLCADGKTTYQMLWPECLWPPITLPSQAMASGSGTCGKWLGHEGESLMSGISALRERDPKELPDPFRQVMMQWEVSKPKERPHLTMLGKPILDF